MGKHDVLHKTEAVNVFTVLMPSEQKNQPTTTGNVHQEFGEVWTPGARFTKYLKIYRNIIVSLS